MDENTLGMTINGHSAALGVLIDHLAERGLIDREDLAKAFKDCAEAMHEVLADEYGPKEQRLDVAILKALSVTTRSHELTSPVQLGSSLSSLNNDP